jgi:hypothetical protein
MPDLSNVDWVAQNIIQPAPAVAARGPKLIYFAPSDVYFGRDKAILQQRERIKRKTLETRRLHHRQLAA